MSATAKPIGVAMPIPTNDIGHSFEYIFAKYCFVQDIKWNDAREMACNVLNEHGSGSVNYNQTLVIMDALDKAIATKKANEEEQEAVVEATEIR